MVGRNPARYLAPIVLAATAVGVYLIVTQHVGSDSVTRTATQLHGAGPRPHGQFSGATFYTVKPGDNLTAIATKTGVPISTLEQLNPSLNPDALQTGQRIRLRQ